ncbi:MAG: hypothetical protein ACI9EW_000025 [Cellvibrionaceae bacterium]|jgi:hypothetical protein
MNQGTGKTVKTIIITSAIAIVLAAIAGAIIWRVYQGDSTLLRNVVVSSQRMTPNADGDTDLIQLSYDVSRNATVSIWFENTAGDKFWFRRDRPRGVGEYQVLFSGVVEGYRLPDEIIQGAIEARLLQDGNYSWVIEAIDIKGVREEARGPLAVVDADSALPEMRDFSLDKDTFTPNRDGINDRVLIQYNLQKDANVRVMLVLPGGGELPLFEKERDVPAGMPGRHYYDYEGGVDNGETPPADGVYQIVAYAEDAEGQKMRVEDELTIELGGVPRADIFAPAAGDTFEVSATAISICNTLFFTMTVENYGDTPIRTTGPSAGTVYDSDENYNSIGWSTESGAWRVAIGFENELSNYPYRWAVGTEDDLVEIDGFQYLMPGDRALVTGGIRIVAPFGERNPQPIWAGLIHEDVEVSQFNNRVDPKAILIDLPDPENIEPCE